MNLQQFLYGEFLMQERERAAAIPHAGTVIPAPQPGQTWAPTRAGSRAKARYVTTVGPDRIVTWDATNGRYRGVSPATFRRWVRSCDARPVVTP